MKKFDLVAVLDFETTGLKPHEDYPTEVAVKVFSEEGLVAEYSSMIMLPEGVEVPEFITNLTGLTTEKVNSEGADIEEVKGKLLKLLTPPLDISILVIGHNVNFDLGFLYYHFGIQVPHFMCTRTIEILSNPVHNASLQNTHERWFPEHQVEQEHRASSDVDMTFEVFVAQANFHGSLNFGYFLNRLVNMPDRELTYAPQGAIVLDFAHKYVSERTHKKAVEELEEAEFHIGELMGVMDNIHGDSYAEYDEAYNFMNRNNKEEN
jgi:DNA polymerase III subunit epsilon